MLLSSRDEQSQPLVPALPRALGTSCEPLSTCSVSISQAGTLLRGLVLSPLWPCHHHGLVTITSPALEQRCYEPGPVFFLREIAGAMRGKKEFQDKLQILERAPVGTQVLHSSLLSHPHQTCLTWVIFGFISCRNSPALP